MDGFEKNGTKPFPEKDLQEKWQDEKDHEAILAEQKEACHPERAEGQESEQITYSNGVTTRTAPNPNYVPTTAEETTSSVTATTKPQQPVAPTKPNPAGEFVDGVRQRVMSAA